MRVACARQPCSKRLANLKGRCWDIRFSSADTPQSILLEVGVDEDVRVEELALAALLEALLFHEVADLLVCARKEAPHADERQACRAGKPIAAGMEQQPASQRAPLLGLMPSASMIMTCTLSLDLPTDNNE